jgi:hypothetical protein
MEWESMLEALQVTAAGSVRWADRHRGTQNRKSEIIDTQVPFLLEEVEGKSCRIGSDLVVN